LYKGLVAHGIDASFYPASQGPVIDSPPCDSHHEVSELGIRENCITEIITTTELFEMSSNFDLIHSHSHLLSLGYSRLVETPVLATMHDQPEPESLPLFEKLDGKTYYVSTSNSDRIPQLTYRGTVYDGIDVSSYPLRSREPEETILFVGNLKPDNGIDDALEIARLSGHKLILAGRVLDHGYVQRLEIQSATETEIVDICEMDASQRASIYDVARALVLPQGIDHPFRHVVLESLACGTPVISRYTDFLGEILTQDVNARWFESVGEALSALDKIASISPEDCRASIEERFSTMAMVNAYVRLYREILQCHIKDERRPWGYFEVLLDDRDHKVKRIGVYPGKRLSLQRHKFRSEHWFMVSGVGEVTLDDQVIRLLPGQCIQIPVGAKHRMMNAGNDMVVFVETQTGSYFGEDDIERFEDDFGRIDQSL
jgi:mannose-6-phosphate isomerase-like protein (cupin superfamily)